MVRVASYFAMTLGAFVFWQSMDKVHVWIALHQDEKVLSLCIFIFFIFLAIPFSNFTLQPKKTLDIIKQIIITIIISHLTKFNFILGFHFVYTLFVLNVVPSLYYRILMKSAIFFFGAPKFVDLCNSNLFLLS